MSRYGDLGVSARLKSERAAVDLAGGRRMGDDAVGLLVVRE